MRLISAQNVSLGWCVLGYMFLDHAEASFAMMASMAAITTACFGRKLEAFSR